MASKKAPTKGEILAKNIVEQYNHKTIEDIQNTLKDILGPMFEAMLQGEINVHLGYKNNDRSE